MNPMPSPDTDEFFGLVYTELRRLAAQHLRRERSNHTLQPTALVHEAYLELASSGGWQNRAHFFGVASLAMRRVLVAHARRRNTSKRDAKLLVSLETASEGDTAVWDFHLLELALNRLEADNAALCRVFEARYFAGYRWKRPPNSWRFRRPRSSAAGRWRKPGCTANWGNRGRLRTIKTERGTVFAGA